MTHKIKFSSLVENISLRIDDKGVAYYSGVVFSSTRRFRFEEVAAILLSEDGTSLSFQVGQEVFSISVKPGNVTQREAINAFTAAVAKAQPGYQNVFL